MIEVSHIAVYNFDNAVRGARNAHNSWAKIDSGFDEAGRYILGPNDLDLCMRLCKAGSDHRKFMRQILVSMDINAPLYWWKEYDTYKVATVANSTSTMHKIHSKAFAREDFSFEQVSPLCQETIDAVLAALERERQAYVATKDKKHWWNIIQLLPSSYNQLRTCSLNYETLRNIAHARQHHKLDEWRAFCGLIRSLPYAQELIFSPAESV